MEKNHLFVLEFVINIFEYTPFNPIQGGVLAEGSTKKYIVPSKTNFGDLFCWEILITYLYILKKYVAKLVWPQYLFKTC